MAHTHADAPAFDPLDPHGQNQPGHGGHATHVIVTPFMLRSVLVILLLFTAATVGMAQLEMWAQPFFGIALPKWVNVVGVLAIATVKSILVVLFFMQLRYDNPMNSLVLVASIFCLVIFISFTAIDLFTRGAIDPVKYGQVTKGGTGAMVAAAGGKPMYQAAKDRLIEAHGQSHFDALEHATHAHHPHPADHSWYPAGENSPNKTRRRTGMTDALKTDAPAPAADHAHPH
ncbi:MAG: cytochrome C oxidase subunit IV family protein [Phycisphaerales bacterium]|nr:cytochrome C oxidase subunit IV family protein [Phycisphaerales bacterium]